MASSSRGLPGASETEEAELGPPRSIRRPSPEFKSPKWEPGRFPLHLDFSYSTFWAAFRHVHKLTLKLALQHTLQDLPLLGPMKGTLEGLCGPNTSGSLAPWLPSDPDPGWGAWVEKGTWHSPLPTPLPDG